MRAHEFLYEDVENFPIANVRRANGAIGTQGVNTEQAADVLTHAAGMQVSSDMSMHQLVDALKADPEAQQRLRQFVQKNPVTVYALPDGSYHLQDGNHRTFLLNLLGDETVPAEVKEGVAETTDSKQLDPDIFEDLDSRIIARAAKKTVPSIQAKQTPEGYVYLKTADGLSLVIGCNIADGSIDINIGSQPMETTSSGPHKGAITEIIQAVYAAAVKQYGTPSQPGTLSVDHDAGHGVWQHIAQKLGLQYDAHMVKENFADGRHPEDKGDSKRLGVPTKASISTLRKVAKQGGRKGQLAHWLANMKSGREKARRT